MLKHGAWCMCVPALVLPALVLQQTMHQPHHRDSCSSSRPTGQRLLKVVAAKSIMPQCLWESRPSEHTRSSSKQTKALPSLRRASRSTSVRSWGDSPACHASQAVSAGGDYEPEVGAWRLVKRHLNRKDRQHKHLPDDKAVVPGLVGARVQGGGVTICRQQPHRPRWLLPTSLPDPSPLVHLLPLVSQHSGCPPHETV